MAEIKVFDKTFVTSITADEIAVAVDRVAAEITRDYADKQPMFLVILNGAFMFAADLLKRVTIPATMSCIRVASYEGMQSTGVIREVLGLREDITGRHLVLIEDIVDTGNTMHDLIPQLMAKGAASVEVCTFLQKPEALQHPDAQPKYVGFKIPNLFVIGYGLDFDGWVRNLPEVYVLKED